MLTTEQVRGHFVTAPMVASPREAAYDQFDEWYVATRTDARVTMADQIAAYWDTLPKHYGGELFAKALRDFASGAKPIPVSADTRSEGS